MKRVYFASDFHLGIPNREDSFKRELKIIRWLDGIQTDCAALYILGDIFDFWFEYKLVVPKGFVRLQAKIASFTDSGIPVYFFHGNHDLWQFGYFEEELGVKVIKKPIYTEILGKKFYLAHGDGLGLGQTKFKLILAIYRNYFFQRLFAFFHPSIGIGIANWMSAQSKIKTFDGNFNFYGEQEHLIQHCRMLINKGETADYYVYGHRHLPMIYDLGNGASYVNLGDWIGYYSYVVFDGESLSLETFEKSE